MSRPLMVVTDHGQTHSMYVPVEDPLASAFQLELLEGIFAH
jgi:hypothetical protein